MKFKSNDNRYKKINKTIVLIGLLILMIGSSNLVFAVGTPDTYPDTVIENQNSSTNLNSRRPDSTLANGGFLKIFAGISSFTLGWEPNSSYIYEFPDKSINVGQENETQMVNFYKNFRVTSLALSFENENVSVEQLGPKKFIFKRKIINTSGTVRIKPNIDYIYNAELWRGAPPHAGGPRLEETLEGISEHFTNSSGIIGNEYFNIYLEPTPELVLEKKQQERTIELGSDFKQIATDFFNVKQSAGKVSSNITQYPDFSKVGKTSASIKVWDEYNAPQTFTVPFNVVDSRNLTLDIVNQDVTLGESVEDLDLNKSVKNVQLGSKTLDIKDYEIKINNTDETKRFQVVGSTEYDAIVKEKTTGKTLKVKLPFNVKWGSSIYLKGDFDGTIGAVTLHQNGENMLLTDTLGTDSSHSFINYSFKGQRYYRLELLTVSDVPKHLDRLGSLYLTGGAGDDFVEQKIHSFGEEHNGQQTASIGNIIKVFHKESSTREHLIVNEQETKENNDSDTVYYELTRNGFQPLRVNQLTSRTGTIPFGASKQYLNEHIKDYIDLKGYRNIEVKEFSVYPLTDESGETSGKILVEETLQSGEKVQWEYTVPFQVSEKSLIAEVVSQDVTLGETLGNLDLNKSVKTVKLGNQIVDPKAYEINIDDVDEKTIFNRIGKQEYEATIKEKTNGKTLKVKLPFNIKWGSTIYLKGYGDYSIGAVTLHQNEDELFLTDTEGMAGNPNYPTVHSSFKGELYYDLQLLMVSDTPQYLNSLKPASVYSYLSRGKGDDNSLEKIHFFGDNADGQQKANVGNIIKVFHKEAKTRERLMVNEREVKENNDLDTVYYELTRNGFQPVRANQLTSKTGIIPLYTSKQYLNEHIKEYIDLKGYRNIEVKKFSDYPITNKAGITSGKIVVEETLQSGKKVQWEYVIPFTILEGSLDLSVPKTMDFNEFSPSKVEQTIQRKYTGDLGLTIKDSRGNGKQGGWSLTAKVQKTTTGITPYLVFSENGKLDKPLTDAAIVYKEAKEENATEPLEVKVSALWGKNEGIVLKIPAKSKLESNKAYSEIINWNLVEGP